MPPKSVSYYEGYLNLLQHTGEEPAFLSLLGQPSCSLRVKTKDYCSAIYWHRSLLWQ